jgi:hypothetical protein
LEFKVEITGLNALIAKFKQAPEIAAPILQRAISGSAAVLATNTNSSTVPIKSGFLIQSFGARFGNLMMSWGPDVNYKTSYSSFVEFGTKPHTIYPKDKKALFWPGASHPVRSVNHPGTKPNPFMERILAASQSGINDQFGKALQLITEAIAAQ